MNKFLSAGFAAALFCATSSHAFAQQPLIAPSTSGGPFSITFGAPNVIDTPPHLSVTLPNVSVNTLTTNVAKNGDPDPTTRGWFATLYCGSDLAKEVASDGVGNFVAKEMLNLSEGNPTEQALAHLANGINWWICKGMPSLDGIRGMVEAEFHDIVLHAHDPIDENDAERLAETGRALEQYRKSGDGLLPVTSVPLESCLQCPKEITGADRAGMLILRATKRGLQPNNGPF